MDALDASSLPNVITVRRFRISSTLRASSLHHSLLLSLSLLCFSLIHASIVTLYRLHFLPPTSLYIPTYSQSLTVNTIRPSDPPSIRNHKQPRIDTHTQTHTDRHTRPCAPLESLHPVNSRITSLVPELSKERLRRSESRTEVVTLLKARRQTHTRRQTQDQ